MSYLASSVARRVKNPMVCMISRRVSSTKAAENSFVVARSGEEVREAARSEAMGRDEARRIGSAGDLALYKEFEEWMIRFEKSYDSEAEKQRRFQTFKTSVKKIEYYNQSLGRRAFGLTQFCDLTSEEFGRTYLCIPRAEEVSLEEKKCLAPWLYEEIYGREALLKRNSGVQE